MHTRYIFLIWLILILPACKPATTTCDSLECSYEDNPCKIKELEEKDINLDDCYVDWAIEEGDLSICDRVSYPVGREDCRYFVDSENERKALQKQIPCEDRVGNDKKICIISEARSAGDEDKCLELKNDADQCFNLIAIDKKNKEICKNILIKEDMNKCIEQASTIVGGRTYCNEKEGTSRQLCYYTLALYTEDRDVCELIQTYEEAKANYKPGEETVWRDDCWLRVALSYWNTLTESDLSYCDRISNIPDQIACNELVQTQIDEY